MKVNNALSETIRKISGEDVNVEPIGNSVSINYTGAAISNAKTVSMEIPSSSLQVDITNPDSSTFSPEFITVLDTLPTLDIDGYEVKLLRLFGNDSSNSLSNGFNLNNNIIKFGFSDCLINEWSSISNTMYLSPSNNSLTLSDESIYTKYIGSGFTSDYNKTGNNLTIPTSRLSMHALTPNSENPMYVGQSRRTADQNYDHLYLTMNGSNQYFSNAIRYTDQNNNTRYWVCKCNAFGMYVKFNSQLDSDVLLRFKIHLLAKVTINDVSNIVHKTLTYDTVVTAGSDQIAVYCRRYNAPSGYITLLDLGPISIGDTYECFACLPVTEVEILPII